MDSRFNYSWFPMGGILVSTMTRWAHPGTTLKEWIEQNTFDLEQMKAQGMTSVGILQDWEMNEPEEGRYDFCRYDPLMDACARLGLKVVLWPWDEVQPAWISRNHSDWCGIADDGSRSPLGSWLHPEFRKSVHRWLEALVLRYRNHEATMMWNVAIEPFSRISWTSRPVHERNEKLFCYNAASVECFRQWLQERHSDDLDSLNRRWNTYYTEWRQVEPPRFNPHYSWMSPAMNDWRVYYNEAVSGYQISKAKVVAKLDPEHPTTGNSGWLSVGVYCGLNPHTVAKEYDSFGVSHFPIYRSGRSPVVTGEISYDYMLSVCHPDKPCFVHELQGGPQVIGASVGEEPTPEDVAQWCWHTVGKGYRGIYFWSWRPHRAGPERGGFGLVNLDGTSTARSKRASEVSKTFQAIAPLLNRLRPARPKVGVVFGCVNHGVCYGEGRVCGEEKYVWQHTDNVRGWHELLYHFKLPRRFLDEDQLFGPDAFALDGLEALVLPYLSTLDNEQMETIAAFVRRGGLVWSDPWLGYKDRTGTCRDTTPSEPLAELFGCTQGRLFPIVDDSLEHRAQLWHGGKMLSGATCRVPLDDGSIAELPTRHHNIELLPRDGAEVIGRFENDSPGLVRNTVGEGVCYYSGTYAADAMRKTAVSGGFEMAESAIGSSGVDNFMGVNAYAFFKQMFDSRGIYSPVEPQFDCHDDVVAYLLVGEGEALAVFVNYRPDAVEGDWRIRLDFTPAGEAKDLANDRAVSYTPLADGATLPLNLPRYGIAAVYFQR